ncbi:hypothetical protein Hanom_Chr08g00741981 [Helianthus anomalus]
MFLIGIGERCGRLLVKSEASSEDGNMAEDRMAVLVQSGKRISSEMNITWKEHSIKVWVEEIAGQWSPAFLTDDTSEESDIGESPECEWLAEFRGKVSKGCMLDDEFSCMGNPNDCPSSKSAVHVHGKDMLSASCMAAGYSHVEREAEGPGKDGFNSPYIGLNMDSSRPNYITTRPKVSKNNRNVAHNFKTPDLNNEVHIGEDTDPFNIGEILRLEEEERRTTHGAMPRQEVGNSEESCKGEEQIRQTSKKKLLKP